VKALGRRLERLFLGAFMSVAALFLERRLKRLQGR
jgi:hypothetical protein